MPSRALQGDGAAPDSTPARATFRELHRTGCFVIPNPWDVGTARAIATLGFPALATTSAGFAFSRGLPDSPDALALDDVLEHIAAIVAATDLPVNADFQAGYAADPGLLAAHSRRCIETGVAGFSIEDTTGSAGRSLFDRTEAVERIGAARAAIDDSGADVLLTARAEVFLVGHPDPLSESIWRLQAYAAAGADVLFAPGVRDPEDIRALVEAVRPNPLNVLVSADTGVRVTDLAELGVRRISVGSALARTAWSAFLDAARTIAAEGAFTGIGRATPFSELNELFGPA
jgi:2-methylisocitrate lyase-like PEP mutase family enzyme